MENHIMAPNNTRQNKGYGKNVKYWAIRSEAPSEYILGYMGERSETKWEWGNKIP